MYRRPAEFVMLWTMVPAFRVLSALCCAGAVQAAVPTFSKDVAPVFFQHCVNCHRPGDVAPMSLLDYKSARPWARAIREATSLRRMPPWFADPRYGHFANDARLSEEEMRVIRDWVDGGAPEGDASDLPRTPEFAEGWRLGKPDIVIAIDEHIVNPGEDAYETFVVPGNLKEGIWIRAAELRPGNRKVVHHAHVNPITAPDQAGPATIKSMSALSDYLERDGKLTRIRTDAPVLDDACAANAPDLPFIHGSQPGALASYLPGRDPDTFYDGSAKWIPPGTSFQFSIHYARLESGKESDRTSVGLYLAPRPPDRPIYRMDLRNFFFLIPAGESNHEVRRCYTFDEDKLLLSITPHMHYRGKDVRYELTHVDGRRETLLYVPTYNFDWQLTYRFRDPIPVRKGSVLTLTAHFDNSRNNPANPDPSKAVRWGDKSEEEMFSNYFEYLPMETKSVAASANR
jgi:hypothetical protein